MKKIPVIYYLLGLFLYILSAAAAIAAPADDLKQAEALYKKAKYAEVEQICLSLIKNNPDDPNVAYEAYRRLPALYIAVEKPEQARAAIEQLLIRAADHEKLPSAVQDIVERAKALGKTQQAGRLYQDILNSQPQYPQDIWMKMGIAITNAHLGNDEAVDAAMKNIIDQYGLDEQASRALGNIAWTYRKLEKYEQARNVYQYLVDTWPKRDDVAIAQRGIVLCNMELGDQAGARAALQKLITDFADSPYLAKALEDIAGRYYRKGEFAEARKMHRDVVEKFADSNDPNANTIIAQRNAILSSVGLEDEELIAGDIQTLLTLFSQDSDFVSVLYYVAERLGPAPQAEDKAAKFAQRATLYQYIINNYPEHELAVLAKGKLAWVRIQQGDEKAAEAIFQTVLTDYSAHPRLAEAVRIIGEGYYEKALSEKSRLRREIGPDYIRQLRANGPPESVRRLFEKGIEKFELVIQSFQENPVDTPAAYFLAAESYSALKQHRKVIEYYQVVYDNWPDYKYARQLQYLIGRIYIHLKDTGAMPASEADLMIKEAYEQVVRDDPDSSAANSARSWLNNYHKKLNKGGQR